jgi:hypothetical protein
MNDLTSFPRADTGLLPNVPVNALYERIRALITAREDRDGLLKSLLKRPDPYEDWRSDHAQFAACQFLHELFDTATIRAYFEDDGNFRKLTNGVLGIKNPSDDGEAHKLLTLSQGRACAIELSQSNRVLGGKSLYLTGDAMAIAEVAFEKRFPLHPERPIDLEPAQRELAADLATRDRWQLAEALFWIGTRSFERMAEHLVTARLPGTGTPYYDIGPGMQVCIISQIVDGRPATDLIDALTRGRVSAVGCFEGRGRRESIPAGEWGYLEFRDNHGCNGRVIASRTSGAGSTGNFMHGLNGAWFDVDFDRVEIRKAFPVPVPSRPEFSDEQIAGLLRSFEDDGAPLATNLAWSEVKSRMPGVTRDRMINVRDTLGYGKKPGPKAARNRAK